MNYRKSFFTDKLFFDAKKELKVRIIWSSDYVEDRHAERTKLKAERGNHVLRDYYFINVFFNLLFCKWLSTIFI